MPSSNRGIGKKASAWYPLSGTVLTSSPIVPDKGAQGEIAQTIGGLGMNKFLALYMANRADFEKMMKTTTPEQQQKGMAAWMKWMGDHKSSIGDGGAPLGKSKRV